MSALLQGLFASHYFSQLHFVLVVIHVSAALLALVVAPVAMIVQKGGKQHRVWGKVYFWGMFVTNLVALLLLFWRFNPFLFGVTVLSFYGAFSGYRVVFRKHPQRGAAPTRLDWGVASLTLFTGVGLISWAGLVALGWLPVQIPSGGSVWILFVLLPTFFGFSAAQSAWVDLRSFRQPSPDRYWWWYYHMERMLGSYTALLTALMVQQVGPRLPGAVAWIVWVAPAVLSTVAISYWIGYYRRQFAGRQVAVQPVKLQRMQTAAD